MDGKDYIMWVGLASKIQKSQVIFHILILAFYVSVYLMY